MKKQERELLAAGYEFSGIWDRSYKLEEVKARAAELRSQGHKARVIADDGGYSVYWIESEASKLKKQQNAINSKISKLTRERETLLARLPEIEQEIKDAQQQLEALPEVKK